MGIHHPSNRTITLRSVYSCDKPAYRDRGDIGSGDGSFRCDAISRIRLNGRDAILTDARQVFDTFLIEVRQECEVGNTFASNMKHRSIWTELDVG